MDSARPAKRWLDDASPSLISGVLFIEMTTNRLAPIVDHIKDVVGSTPEGEVHGLFRLALFSVDVPSGVLRAAFEIAVKDILKEVGKPHVFPMDREELYFALDVLSEDFGRLSQDTFVRKYYWRDLVKVFPWLFLPGVDLNHA